MQVNLVIMMGLLVEFLVAGVQVDGARGGAREAGGRIPGEKTPILWPQALDLAACDPL